MQGQKGAILGGELQVPLALEPPRVLEGGTRRRRGTWAIQGGVTPEQSCVLKGGGAREQRSMCAQEGGRECVQRGTRKGGRAQEQVAPGVPTQEGRAEKGGTLDGLVHQAWRAYLIAHPWHRGPHRCDGIYPLQCQCSNPLIRSPQGDDI